MKTCSVCKETKNLEHFHKRLRAKDGLSSACILCRKQIDRISYLENPKRRGSIDKARKAKTSYNRTLARRYKRFCGCFFCKEREPVALDLHHINDNKDADPSSLISGSTLKLKIEIRKCIVLCANCHRKVHAGLLSLD